MSHSMTETNVRVLRGLIEYVAASTDYPVAEPLGALREMEGALQARKAQVDDLLRGDARFHERLERLERENAALIDCGRVLEAYTGCADKDYHGWLDRRDQALAALDAAFAKMRCQGCEDAPLGQHTGLHDWQRTPA